MKNSSQPGDGERTGRKGPSGASVAVEAGNGGSGGLLGMLAVVLSSLVVLAFVLSYHGMASAVLDTRAKAESLLYRRMSRLAALPLPLLPRPGVYGVGGGEGAASGGGLPPGLAALLESDGPVCFRLEVFEPIMHRQEEEAAGVDSGLRGFRLSCHWSGGSSDLVLLRGPWPVFDSDAAAERWSLSSPAAGAVPVSAGPLEEPGRERSGRDEG